MKALEKILRTIASAVVITMITVILASSESNAAELYIKGHATAYCLTGTTASGLKTQYGICAMNTQTVREQNLMGKYVVLYQRLPDGTAGKEIGTFLIADTGCKKNVIDVWQPSLELCQNFMNTIYEDGCKGKIFYQILEEGEEDDRRSNRQSIE